MALKEGISFSEKSIEILSQLILVEKIAECKVFFGTITILLGGTLYILPLIEYCTLPEIK
jgi:hypothetical protein